MEVDYALFASGIRDNPDGSKDLTRIVNRVLSDVFPFEVSQVSLMVGVTFSPEDVGKPFEMEAEIIDADGRAVGPRFTAEFHTQDLPTDRWVTDHLQLLPRRLRIEKPGMYRCDVRLNGKTVRQVPINIDRAEPDSPPRG